MLGPTVVNINISANAATLVRTSMRESTSMIKQFYQNTATLLKPYIITHRVNSVQRVKCREDIAAVPSRRNIKSRMCQPPVGTQRGWSPVSGMGND